jgi:hypothetical protein
LYWFGIVTVPGFLFGIITLPGFLFGIVTLLFWDCYYPPILGIIPPPR